MNDSVLLTDAVVVITGAGSGLGRAYALDAAAAGAVVVVNDINAAAAEAVADEIRGAGGTADVDVSDVTDAAAAFAMIKGAASRHGRLDGLVANAGLRPEGPAWEEDPIAMRRAVEVNLLGTLYCGVPALALMRERGTGSIVAVTSRAQRGIPESASYAATKGAIASLTWSWAIDMLGTGVRVNAVAPQAGRTGTRRSTAREDPSEPGPELMAPLVRYLLSDRATAVTGQIVRLGGRRDELGLGLMTPPGNDVLFRREGGWDAEAIAELFDTRLVARIGPLGADGLLTVTSEIRGAAVTAEHRPSL